MRSVQSVTLAGNTGVAGNFGITLLRLLCILPFNVQNFKHVFNGVKGMACNIPQVDVGSCLFPVIVPHTAASGTLFLDLLIAED